MRTTCAICIGLVAVASIATGSVSETTAAPEPVLIDRNGDGISLTRPQDGVLLDLDADGVTELVSWTRRGSDDAFLCLDHNRNGVIDVPFDLVGGGLTGPPNGFAFLAAMDGITAKGDGPLDRKPDGFIDAADRLYAGLIVWRDINKDGVSQEDELEGLAYAGIRGIATGYIRDQHGDGLGNRFGFRARVQMDGERGALVVRQALTVQLARVPR